MKISREAKIYFMLVITGGFFLVEIIIGYYVSSLALIADSFHMLNDLISMCIALWAIKLAKKTQYDPKYSYGWQRAEILGALVNGVFLLALCFTIFIDSIERFISPEVVTHPLMVLITGSAGLIANLIGLVLFHDHGHSHNLDIETSKHQHGSLNMKGIFLHVLGDALGNVGVIASALFIWLTSFDWRYYADPIVSVLITIIIFISAVPLVRQTSFILLQGVPHNIQLQEVNNEILQLEGVLSVHEFHIWQLNDTKLIASLHVLIKSRQAYMKLGQKIRELLHQYGIHSVTIQPEFSMDTVIEEKLQMDGIEPSIHETIANEDSQSTASSCLLRCIEDSCLENACCPPEQ
ncbi:cation efflux protein [Cokeromyces recurvatus]|uniref:cation efflux protein n=1 Tax=Cokeromyces recurvatus TaxID=90255 RepID=UPI00221E7320|nr:cation efflux protein [Cokeromyces recurvatus]KAI7897543.1 cation efflux protein [Cokeromyces recurvatus]